MSELRVTFIGLGVFVNRALGMVSIMPKGRHVAKLSGPFGEVSLSPESDLRFTRGRAPLPDEPTHRAGTEYIAHLDHVFGSHAHCPPVLLSEKCPAGINARFFVSGGILQGLPAVAYLGLLRNVLWDFDPAGNRKTVHRQKLTDSSVFTVFLSDGEYEIQVTNNGKITYYLFRLGNDPVDITLLNEDECPRLEKPDYTPEEAAEIFALVGHRLPLPAIKGVPSTGIAPSAANARAKAKTENPMGCVCDPICPQFQIEAN